MVVCPLAAGEGQNIDVALHQFTVDLRVRR
jgi:hypothetical protein